MSPADYCVEVVLRHGLLISRFFQISSDSYGVVFEDREIARRQRDIRIVSFALQPLMFNLLCFFSHRYGSGDINITRVLHNRRFDFAMVAFLDCLRQLMEYVHARDPSIDFPHA